MSKIYTPQIEEYTKEVIAALSIHDDLIGGNFFEIETSSDPSLGKKLLYEIIANKATENFLEREDQSIMLTEEQFYRAFTEVTVGVSLKKLEKEGILGSFENEDEEIFFLTEKGKQTAKEKIQEAKKKQ
jgi:hypothetical protein